MTERQTFAGALSTSTQTTNLWCGGLWVNLSPPGRSGLTSSGGSLGTSLITGSGVQLMSSAAQQSFEALASEAPSMTPREEEVAFRGLLTKVAQE